MTPGPASAFDLPSHRADKADPVLIADDEEHFARVAGSLERSIATLVEQLAEQRLAPGRAGQAALARDQEVHRLTARLRALRRFGLDLCLGRIVGTDGTALWIGRLGLTDDDGQPLLVDWRSRAAEPFFGATHATPMGLVSRRRYRWADGRVIDYWDEVFTIEGLVGHAALDDQSAFIASLGSARAAQMRDVLGTIQADQDAIIRAGSRGALVVDGGPGTGKTVVALHRAAYLLYADPRLREHRGGVLFVGPHAGYLAYVADVLPNLGEEGVQLCTLRDLLPQGTDALAEADPAVAALKATTTMVAAVAAAVAFWEEPPTQPLTVATETTELVVTAQDWAEAFAAPGPGAPHNEVREQVWEELLTILTDKDDTDTGTDVLRRSLRQDRGLRTAFARAWPLLEAVDLVADLWTVPALLRRCAPWLSPDEVGHLQRTGPQVWTVSDLPLLDAARQRLGDPAAARTRRREAAVLASRRAQMAGVVDSLMAADPDGESVLTMLGSADLQEALVDDSGLAGPLGDRLAGPFAHIVVDEAQELTDAEWQMLLVRCPSRSLTIVGDRAQARQGFTESWPERLARVGLDRVAITPLGISYRTPSEVMAEAERVIRTAVPDANVPRAVRSTGIPVGRGTVNELDQVLRAWLTAHPEGIACVIGDPAFTPQPRVRSLSAELSKGLEFDLVVLVGDDDPGHDITAVVDRYVAMTRATQQLVLLSGT